jgi:glycosyltransferase involved in cell wall biosynthesis
MDAHRAGGSADGGSSAQALWRYRKGRALADRGTGRTRKRRHAICQRRFQDLGETRCNMAEGAAPRRIGSRSQCVTHGDAGTRPAEKQKCDDEEFDFLHFHLDYYPFSLFSRQPTPFLTTLHGRLDLPEHQPVFTTFSAIPVISISNAQRRPVPQANWVHTIHHGVPEKLLTPRPVTPSYLAVLGRIAPEKGVDRAIKIAIRCGIPLKIAAKVDRADQNYYDEIIRPLIDRHPLVDYIGEIGDHEKSDFLSGAISLLVPIDWPEPFGLVMIEAMACGTPVIAYNRGSVPEIIDEGLTGFIVEDETSAVAAVGRLSNLNRDAIRKQFEARFTARRMALDYLAAYRSLMESSAPRIRLVSSAE